MEEDKDNQMASEDKEEDIFHHTFFAPKNHQNHRSKMELFTANSIHRIKTLGHIHCRVQRKPLLAKICEVC